MKIENRTFLVSGGAAGLGLATVRMLLQANAYVSILDIGTPPEPILDPSSATSTSSPPNSRVLFHRVDVGNVDDIEKAVEKTVEWTKETGAPLGGVVSSAAIGVAELIINSKGEPHTAKSWEKTLDVNLHGVFHLTRFTLKHLVRQPAERTEDGERGVVVMIASSAAYEGQPGQLAYSATKGALIAMTLPMARDLARHHIRVVTISPSPFTTALTAQFKPKVAQAVQRQALLFPKRYGRPEEFAETVKWIFECPYVNGEVIKLTGGTRVPVML